MTAFNIVIASLSTGVCTLLFGWAGFLGSIVGNVVAAMLFM